MVDDDVVIVCRPAFGLRNRGAQRERAYTGLDRKALTREEPPS
jgi:hypothetical protein